MSEFSGVTILKKASVYFDGNVTSRSIIFADGSRKSLGIMLPGKYEFNTDQKEIMEIISGDLDVSIKGEEGWKTVGDGDVFQVPAKSSFKATVKRITDYCCSYIDA